MTVTLMPTVSYRINDWLSVAGGPTVMYGTLEMDASVPRGIFSDGKASLDGDDTVLGFTLSSLMQVNEQTRLGVFYISEHEFDLSGDLKFSPSGINFGSDTKIPLAQMIRTSVYHDLDDTWSLVGSIGWEDWSTMDNVQIAGGSGGAASPRNWDDTWHYAAGVHYRMDEQWTFRTGIAYDTSPVSAEDRTADMPVDRQVRYAVGANYQWTEDLAVGGSFEYVDLGNNRIKSTNLSGKYSRADMFAFGVYANWSF
jgi:long-chain fatty acid transport protein